MTDNKPAYVTRYVIAKPYHPRGSEGERSAIYDPKSVNVAGFSIEIERTCNDLHDAGYDVISMLPINGGEFSHQDVNSGKNDGTYASPTRGVVIVAALA